MKRVLTLFIISILTFLVSFFLAFEYETFAAPPSYCQGPAVVCYMEMICFDLGNYNYYCRTFIYTKDWLV